MATTHHLLFRIRCRQYPLARCVPFPAHPFPSLQHPLLFLLYQERSIASSLHEQTQAGHGQKQKKKVIRKKEKKVRD